MRTQTNTTNPAKSQMANNCDKSNHCLFPLLILFAPHNCNYARRQNYAVRAAAGGGHWKAGNQLHKSSNDVLPALCWTSHHGAKISKIFLTTGSFRSREETLLIFYIEFQIWLLSGLMYNTYTMSWVAPNVFQKSRILCSTQFLPKIAATPNYQTLNGVWCPVLSIWEHVAVKATLITLTPNALASMSISHGQRSPNCIHYPSTLLLWYANLTNVGKDYIIYSN